jgi:hypothetical protein
MQIACKRFGCQKAVEVCYWTCKHRKNCKDWKVAIEGVPGTSAITERLEMAAAKSGRPFDAKTLVKPVRLKRAVAAAAVPSIAMIAPVAPAPVKIAAQVTVSKLAAPKLTAKPIIKRTHRKPHPVKLAKLERKPMPKPEEEKIEVVAENTAPKSSKPAPKPVKPKLPTNGTVYLLLGKGGKYRELRESELMKEAATILKDPSLRLVKGQYLVPQITFKPFDE